MNIMFIDEDSLLQLKHNLPSLKDKFINPDSSWIIDYFDGTPFKKSKWQIEEFTLDMSQEKPFLTEFENVKRVYSNLRFLSDVEASDERLWAGLCLSTFYRYVQYRWNIPSKATVDNITQHFFFGFGARRSLTRNALARLWWIGRLTYDENRSDHYELTRFVCENADYIMHILERNTSNSVKITKAFISALISAQSDGCLINTDTVGALSKYLNLLGGTYILDCLPEEVIYEKTLNQAKIITEERTIKGDDN